MALHQHDVICIGCSAEGVSYLRGHGQRLPPYLASIVTDRARGGGGCGMKTLPDHVARADF